MPAGSYRPEIGASPALGGGGGALRTATIHQTPRYKAATTAALTKRERSEGPVSAWERAVISFGQGVDFFRHLKVRRGQSALAMG